MAKGKELNQKASVSDSGSARFARCSNHPATINDQRSRKAKAFFFRSCLVEQRAVSAR